MESQNVKDTVKQIFTEYLNANGHHQQSHPPLGRENRLLGNLQLSAQRDTRLRARLHCRQLRNDLLLQAQHLPHGNRHSGSNRYGASKP